MALIGTEQTKSIKQAEETNSSSHAHDGLTIIIYSLIGTEQTKSINHLNQAQETNIHQVMHLID